MAKLGKHLIGEKKYRHKPLVVIAAQFKPGMQDSMYKEERSGREPWDDHRVYIPYINKKNGNREYIYHEDDWIVIDNGERIVLTKKEFKRKYQEIEDEVDIKLGKIFDISQNKE